MSNEIVEIFKKAFGKGLFGHPVDVLFGISALSDQIL
jgi:hypothetical protein